MSKKILFKYNFPEFKVGTSEYAKGPTGCTVFYFPKTAWAAVDIRGGAAVTRENPHLSTTSESCKIDALVFAGGSTFGLEAASGVMQRILEKRNHRTGWKAIPSVPSAVVYDFRRRKNAIYPDIALGKKAFDRAKTNQFIIGRAGAGAHVRAGKYLGGKFAEWSGQSAGFWQDGKAKIFVSSVLNPLGNILDRNGNILLGSMDSKTKIRKSISDELLIRTQKKSIPKGNTTLSVIITNLNFDRSDLHRIAVMAHSALGRTIDPFHCTNDGDSLYVVSTRSQEISSRFNVADYGIIAGRLLQDAAISMCHQLNSGKD